MSPKPLGRPSLTCFKAAYTAQETSKEISRSFRELREVAEQTFGAFGDFNPAISKLSFVLETAGRSASFAMKYLSGLGGAMGPLAALGAGAAAGVAALGAVAVGIATEAAESANKLHELSQSTGVSVETLSRFGYAAKQTGVASEQMTTALERLNKSALAAAIAPAGTANAYTRLGIAVRDANGNLRPTEDILLDVAHKFATMQDGVAKTALAMQLFGRGGAAIIPFLNEGRNGIQEFIEEADRLGVTISGPTAEAAHQFEGNLGKIRGAAQGGANSIMSDFLPALIKLSAYFEAGSEKAMAWGRAIKEAAYTAIPGLAALASLIEMLPDPSSKISALDKFGVDSSAFAGKDFGSWTGQMKPVAIPAPHVPTGSGRADVVAELVEKLQAQAAAELALAAATEKSAAAGVLAKAAAEADVRIAETRTHLLAQEKALRSQLADAKADAAAGTSAESGVEGGATGGTHAARIQAEIAGIQKMLAELDKDAPKIKSLYAEIAGAQFGATAAKDLESFIVKTDEETAALEKMAAAYAQGPLAAQQAAEGAKIAPFEKKRADLGEVIGGLKLIGAPAADIAQLQTAYDELTAAIDRAKVSETAFVAAEISEKIAKEKALLASEAEGFRLVAAAALKSAADQREAAAEAAALKFGAEHPTATGGQLAEVRDTELAKLTQQRAETIAAAAAQFDLNASYAQELEKLQEIKAFLEASGESTIAIDTKIYETRISHLLDYQRQVFESDNQQLLGEAKIYEQAIQLTDAWDKAALEVGSLGDKFKAVSNEIQLEGQNLGANLAQDFKGAMDDASSSLAKFIVTGKGSIRQFFDSFAEKALDSTFKYTFSQIFAGITGPAGGAGAPAGVGPGGTAGTFPGPLGGLAGALGLKLPGAPGAHAPSSVATMNIAAQVVNLSGSPALGGAASSTGAADGSSSSPWYSIFTDSTGNPFGVGNALPITGEASALTASLPFTASDNQRAFAASGILGLPGLPGTPGAPGSNPSLLTSVAGGALGGANGTATAPFYVISAIGALGGFASSSGSSSGPLGSLGSAPGQDVYGNAVFGSGAAAPGAPPAAGAAGGFIGTILKLFGIGASTTSPGGGLGGAISGAGGGAAGAASSTAAATTMQAAAATMVTAATTMTTAAATMQSAAATMSASSSSSGGGGGLFGSLGDLFGGGGGADDASELGDFSDFADLAAFASGGSVSKGVPIIVGENRPEVFVPDQSGRIIRSLPDFENSSVGREMSHRLGGVDFSKISHRESGGSVTAGVPYLAGENRPEVFVPHSFSSSSPRAGGEIHHHHNTVHQYIQTPDADSFRKSQDQLHAEAFAAMNRASYRNG